VIGTTRSVRVFVYATPCDMRKQHDSLAALVRDAMKHDLLRGDHFLFIGRTRKRAKVLFFDGTGLCLLWKRLEKGLFAALWTEDTRTEIRLTQVELALFLEGSTLVGRVPLSPPTVSYGDRKVVFR
jgi:transposase